MKANLLITVALGLAACQSSNPVSAGECGALAMQSIVGEPAAVLALIDLPPPVREIRPGDVVTRDYREERLNFYIDAQERIARVACG